MRDRPFWLRWLLLTLSVGLAAQLVRGITYDSFASVAVTALILGILNTVVRPVLQLLSLPLIVLSLGLFVPVINAWLLLLAAAIVKGFHIAGFWPALGASLIISLVNALVGAPPRDGGFRTFGGWRGRAPAPEPEPTRGPPRGKGRIIDVD